jgi:hypothetical protein
MWLVVVFALGCGGGEAPPSEVHAPPAAPAAPAPAAPAAAPAGEGPTLLSLLSGDTACYATLTENGVERQELATFEMCEHQDLVGSKVTITREKANVMAASCQGDPECKDTEVVDIISSMTAR